MALVSINRRIEDNEWNKAAMEACFGKFEYLCPRFAQHLYRVYDCHTMELSDDPYQVVQLRTTSDKSMFRNKMYRGYKTFKVGKFNGYAIVFPMTEDHDISVRIVTVAKEFEEHGKISIVE